jgi:hypothetical protein
LLIGLGIFEFNTYDLFKRRSLPNTWIPATHRGGKTCRIVGIKHGEGL